VQDSKLISGKCSELSRDIVILDSLVDIASALKHGNLNPDFSYYSWAMNHILSKPLIIVYPNTNHKSTILLHKYIQTKYQTLNWIIIYSIHDILCFERPNPWNPETLFPLLSNSFITQHSSFESTWLILTRIETLSLLNIYCC